MTNSELLARIRFALRRKVYSLFAEVPSSRSGRGFSTTSAVQFNQGDTFICLLDLQRSEGSVADFPSTSQLGTSFEVKIK